MKSAALRDTFVLAALAGLLACNAADVPVYAAASAGTGGMIADASAGAAGGAGVVSGAAGMTFGDTGGAGASAGQGGGDVSAGGGDTVCHGNADCPETFFCQTQTCERGAPGVCVVKQPLCDSDLRPVCGCDHLTYWNDCLREQYGISLLAQGACSTGARTCHGNNECQGLSGATCAHLLPPGVGCGTVADQGTCWVTPPDCSMTGDTRQWQSCPPPGSGGSLGPCSSTCEAVKVGHPFIQADRTTCP